MRHHDELKLEEVAGLRISMLLRLVDFGPDLAHVLVDHSLDGLEWHALIIISQHEEKLFGGGLVEQLQVHLEDHLK